MAGIWIAITVAVVTVPLIQGDSLRAYHSGAALASTTLLLGTLIFHRGWMGVYLSQRTSGLESIADAVYHTLRLFAFKGVDSPPGGTGTVTNALATGGWRPVLWVIVLGAPLLTLGALVTAIRDWRHLKFAMRRGHTVLIGAGDRGATVIADRPIRWPRSIWRRAIAVDIDSRFRDLIAERADFLEDDARSARVLRRVQLRRATAVLISTGSKPLNAEIARLATAEAGAPNDRVVFHAKNADLLPIGQDGGEPFDHDLIVCQRVLLQIRDSRRIVFLVDGGEPLVRSLMLAIGRSTASAIREGPVELRLVGDDVISLRTELMVEPVMLSSGVEVDAVEVNLRRSLVESDERARLVEAIQRFEPGVVVVAAPDDELTQAVAEAADRAQPSQKVVRVLVDILSSAPRMVGGLSVGPGLSSMDVLAAVQDRRERLVRPLAAAQGSIVLRHGLSVHTPMALVPALSVMLPTEQDVRSLLNVHACGVPEISGPEVWSYAASKMDSSVVPMQRFVAVCEGVRGARGAMASHPTVGGCTSCAIRRRLAEELGDTASRLLSDMARVAHACDDLPHARQALVETLVDCPTIAEEPLLEVVTAVEAGARVLTVGGTLGSSADHWRATEILTNALAQRYDLTAERAVPTGLASARELVVVGTGTEDGVSAILTDVSRGLLGSRPRSGGEAVYSVAAGELGPSSDSGVRPISLGGEGCTSQRLLCDGILLFWAHLLARVSQPDEVVAHASWLALVSGRHIQDSNSSASDNVVSAVAEIELARALGMRRIAWVDLDYDRDPRERNAVIERILPGPVDDVLPLPPDRMTLRAWLHQQASAAGMIAGPLAQSQQLPTRELERLAEQIHHAYVEDQRAAGRLETDPALAPWSRLSGALRASNFAAARDWVEKIAAVAPETPASLLRLSDDGNGAPARRRAALDLLAELEHGRFVVERATAGWRFGDRSVALQRTHTLVPWDELSEAERDKDRRSVLVAARVP